MRQVEIYTRALCGYCERAKRLLRDKGVEFIEHDVTMDPEGREEMIRRSHGGTTFPQIFIDGEHIGGSEDLLRLESEGRLDAKLRRAS
jgi:glutaredoxin 3